MLGFCQRVLLASILVQMTVGNSLADERMADILISDSFETGEKVPDGWVQGMPVRGVSYIYDKAEASDGKRSLSLQKTERRFFPIAEWTRTFEHKSDQPGMRVSAKIKAAKAAKAVIDVQMLDASGKPLGHEWVAYVGQKVPKDPLADHDWKLYERSIATPQGTTKVRIAFQIYGPGKVWIDELDVRYVDTVTDTNDQDSKEPESPKLTGVADANVPTPIEVETSSKGTARYILLPPIETSSRPKTGAPLLLVLPGGDGSVSFYPFVSAIHKTALDGRFAVAELLAPPQIVWPTRSSPTRSNPTEESIAAVIDDVVRRSAIDRKQVYALGWSSSGPALYATMLQEHSPLAGAYIAMSVFKPDTLPSLARASGRRFYLLHSPEDAVCPYRMAKDAEIKLVSAGGQVHLVDYEGGHGWHGNVFEMIRTGMQWLQQLAPPK